MTALSRQQERKRRRLALGSKYVRRRFYDEGVCTYCGDDCDSLDHSPPLSVAESLDLDRFRSSGGELLLVPACRRCNTWLSNKPLYTVAERKQYCWTRWDELFRRDFAIPKWDANELAELGPVLRHYVKTASHTADWVRRRIAFCELPLPEVRARAA